MTIPNRFQIASTAGALSLFAAPVLALNTGLPFVTEPLPAQQPLALGVSNADAAPHFNLAVFPDEPAAIAPAAGAADDSQELAKKLSNPVASLISVPFQFNYDEGFGPKDAGRVLLNIQPVIPISLSEDWNLIIRTILPIIYLDSPANGVDSEFGIGDTTQSFFLSPTKGDFVWAVGPVFLWPTGTPADTLGSEKWGVGPTGLILKQAHGWTYGVLANHIWSYAGDDDRSDVSTTFLQPFLSYTWPTATTLGVNTESTYDWTAEQWTVPLNVFVSQVMKIAGQPISLQIGGRYYAESPSGGPEWGARFTFTLLFPK